MNRKVIDTSVDAYRSLKVEEIRAIYKIILDSLSTLETATTEEIHEYSQISHPKVKHEQIWKRMSDLRDLGLIYRPGIKIKNKSGRSAHKWALTGKTFPNIQPVEKSMQGTTVSDYTKDILNIQKLVQKDLFLKT